MQAEDPWSRLARYVTYWREEKLHLSQPQIASRGGPGVSTQRDIEKALKTSYSKQTMPRLEDALGWEDGSIAAILDGGEPIVRDGEQSQGRSPENNGLPETTRTFRVGLPPGAEDATDAELAEMRANAEAAMAKVWREIRTSKGR